MGSLLKKCQAFGRRQLGANWALTGMIREVFQSAHLFRDEHGLVGVYHDRGFVWARLPNAGVVRAGMGEA